MEKIQQRCISQFQISTNDRNELLAQMSNDCKYWKKISLLVCVSMCECTHAHGVPEAGAGFKGSRKTNPIPWSFFMPLFELGLLTSYEPKQVEWPT